MRPTSLLLVVIAFVSGMILIADYVIANPTLQNVSKILTTWVCLDISERRFSSKEETTSFHFRYSFTVSICL